MHRVQPFRYTPLAPVKYFVLTTGPTLERAIDMSKDTKHGRPIERAIVLPPTLYHWVVKPSHSSQRHMSLAADPPLAHCSPHPLQRLRTDSRKEAGEKLVLLADCLPSVGAD